MLVEEDDDDDDDECAEGGEENGNSDDDSDDDDDEDDEDDDDGEDDKIDEQLKLSLMKSLDKALATTTSKSDKKKKTTAKENGKGAHDNGEAKSDDATKGEEKAGDDNGQEEDDEDKNEDEDDDDDEEESIGSDLDDEAMLKLDESLAQAFKMRKKDKRREIDMLQYKLRALDFIEELLKSSHRLDLTTVFVVSLFLIFQFDIRRVIIGVHFSPRILVFDQTAARDLVRKSDEAESEVRIAAHSRLHSEPQEHDQKSKT